MAKTIDGEWLTMEETCQRLGIKRETVYSYVSRGRLRSRRSTSGRGSEVRADDVEHLASLTAWRRSYIPRPVESAITLIKNGCLYYRSHEVSTLVRDSSFEQVALTLWDDEENESAGPWEADADLVEKCRAAARVLPADATPLDRLRMTAACAGSMLKPPRGEGWSADSRRYAAEFLTTAVRALPHASGKGPGDESRFASMLWSRLSSREPTPAVVGVLDAALILLADHDLPESTRVVRMAARAGVGISGIVRLGLDINGGPVKSATVLGLSALLDGARSAADPYRPRTGEPVPGFGHASYPDGDPRARILLNLLTGVDPDALDPVNSALHRAPLSSLPPPNIGFVLTVLANVGQMVPGAAEAIFAIARSTGWIAHAGEEYAQNPVRGIYHSVYCPR
ncbi:citrate synthase [Acrocarpospora macrocephala]|uniref:citrate synthase (unknown stereospecificity) n=1 Tax=Acrocarpospora macrocephala TaxID=150177 RepID=A0A5M3WTA6_9ACTN|nr:citrate/2-methylcitrate synthase [Acrocarpospora macrocephala]GES09388.1 citrate synthase [Acrocarpospora macrocephala]